MAKRAKNKASILYAIVSNTIVLLLIGLFLLLYLHTNAITNIVKERINLITELKIDNKEKDIKQLGAYIESLEPVKAGSVKYIPAEEAPKILGQGIELDVFDIGESPFRDVVIFNVKASAYKEDFLAQLKDDILENTQASDVIYENVIVDNIKSNLNKFSLAILILTLFFLVLVIVIMYNTINLSMYANRWEIKTMEIIGARDRFIRQPYLKIAGRIALTSFVISSAVLLLIIGGLYLNSGFVESVFNFWFLLLTLLVIFILSFIITISATISIVNRYIYTEESALYE